MKTLKIFALITLTTIGTQVAAQDQGSRLSFELNAGPSIALQDLGNTDLRTGVGFEATFHYRLMPHVGIYTGWGWNRFAADKPVEGIDADYEETGYLFGIQFKHPIKNSALSWFVRGGGLYNHIEVENSDGDIIEDTGHGLGFHAATGLEVHLSDSWRVNPSVTFHSLSRDAEIGGENQTLDLRYLGGRIGILRYF